MSEIISQLDKFGLRPATPEELGAFGRQVPTTEFRYSLFTDDEDDEDEDGDSDEDEDDEAWSAGWLDEDDRFDNYRFLCVRK